MLGRDDLVDPLRRSLHLVGLVHHDVVVVAGTGQLDRGVALPQLQLLDRLGGPAAEPVEERLEGRRHDEDQERVRHALLDRVRALHVDLEDDVLACRQRLRHFDPRGAVPVPVDFVCLEQLAGIAQGEEPLRFDEVVADAIDLPRSRGPGRAGHHEVERPRPLALAERVDDGVLADARRPGDDRQQRAGRAHPVGARPGASATLGDDGRDGWWRGRRLGDVRGSGRPGRRPRPRLLHVVGRQTVDGAGTGAAPGRRVGAR